MCLEESSLVLVEKNVVDNNIISILYKDTNNNYVGKIYDYNTKEELNIEDVIRPERINEYNKKIEELIYLKYPKFIADSLIKADVKKSYILRDNELVIYFNDYIITPEITEVLYLKVNYNEIRDYL